MLSIPELLQQGAGNLYVLLPSAILLGALHGLEPGHSKTMMAAFIVAIRGTALQAVLLGLAATISHTAVVWGIALTGMYLYQGLDAEAAEPYMQLASGGIILGIAAWMLWRTHQDRRAFLAGHDHDHHHGHDHGHHHGPDHHDHDEVRTLDTGRGQYRLEIFEQGVPPVWRFRPEDGEPWPADAVTLTIERPDGAGQTFRFRACAGYLESTEDIAEPHDFMVRLRLGTGDDAQDFDVSFLESERGRDPMHAEMRGLEIAEGGYVDAHELAHANDIRRRFAEREVTNGQIALFGLTGGLIPCPAAVTVLLICLHLKQLALGTVLVFGFSVGLALTLVSVGVAAALGARHMAKRFSWFATAAQRAPYFSGALIALVGLYMGWHGWMALAA